MKKGISIILSAPSGTGKTTILKQLRQKLPSLKFSISHTTRQPRPGEQDGVDYFFIDEEEFKQKIANEKFIEWATVHNNYYGTTFNSVHKVQIMDNHIVLELDVQGVDTLRKKKFKGIYIMILPPSLKELRNRLKKRSTESDEKIKNRFEVGKVEITRYQLYDYVVTNRNITDTVNAIINIVRAEENRSSRYIPTAKDIAEVFKTSKDRH